MFINRSSIKRQKKGLVLSPVALFATHLQLSSPTERSAGQG